jgi:hypothetical protein
VSHPQLINKKQKNKYPKFMTEVISPGQKWWWTILGIEISCSQWEVSVCISSALIFFF